MKADQRLTQQAQYRNGQTITAREVVTYPTLLGQAHEEGLARVRTTLVQIPGQDNGQVAIVKAEVETSKGLFEAFGDASPENVDSFLAPHLIRVAETRAKARALRDAVNVGVVSFEELDGVGLSPGTAALGSGAAVAAPRGPAQSARSGSVTPRPRLTQSSNGSEPMTEAQRRYLFRLVAAQGFHKEGAEEHLKDLFQVDALSAVTKAQATAVIDELLQQSPQKEPGRSGTPPF